MNIMYSLISYKEFMTPFSRGYQFQTELGETALRQFLGDYPIRVWEV